MLLLPPSVAYQLPLRGAPVYEEQGGQHTVQLADLLVHDMDQPSVLGGLHGVPHPVQFPVHDIHAYKVSHIM